MPYGAQSQDRSVYLGQSKALVEALQTQWYHAQPIPGWGREQNEWNAHCTLDTLLDYTRITGDRAYDLAVRLEVNDVAFRHVATFDEAIQATPPGRLEVIANYTAFQDIRAELDRVN